MDASRIDDPTGGLGRVEIRLMPARDARRHGARIYVASRASVPARSAEWRRLRDEDGWRISSTWIDEAGSGETADFGELWARIIREVQQSDALLFYAEPDDLPVKGALVEVGAALAAGRPVVACLPGIITDPRTLRPVGSWIAHPLVTRRDNLFVALDEAAIRGDEARRGARLSAEQLPLSITQAVQHVASRLDRYTKLHMEKTPPQEDKAMANHLAADHLRRAITGEAWRGDCPMCSSKEVIETSHRGAGGYTCRACGRTYD